MVRNQTHNETDYYMILSSQEVGAINELFNRVNMSDTDESYIDNGKKWEQLWKDIGDQQEDRANL